MSHTCVLTLGPSEFRRPLQKARAGAYPNYGRPIGPRWLVLDFVGPNRTSLDAVGC